MLHIGTPGPALEPFLQSKMHQVLELDERRAVISENLTADLLSGIILNRRYRRFADPTDMALALAGFQLTRCREYGISNTSSKGAGIARNVSSPSIIGLGTWRRSDLRR